MARMSHDHADARYVFRSAVNLYLGRYDRRLKQIGEEYISGKYEETVARGGAFDFEVVAQDAFRYALDVLNGTPSIEGLDEPAHAA